MRGQYDSLIGPMVHNAYYGPCVTEVQSDKFANAKIKCAFNLSVHSSNLSRNLNKIEQEVY